MIKIIQTKKRETAAAQCEICGSTAPRDTAPCGRRADIAAAARAQIVEKGLEGLRTRDIAKRAGINIATLHYHVPTKEALIQLVADSAREEFIAQDVAHPRDSMTPAQMLRQEIDDYAELLLGQGDLLLVMSEFVERSRRDPLVRKIFSSMNTHWYNKVAEILAAGIKDGSFRADTNPELGARIFIGALIGGAKLRSLDDSSLTEYFNQLERLFLKS